jgi:hypothetical protein
MKFLASRLVAVSLLSVAGLSAPARAEASHDYEIATNDGYGLEDCLAGGAECGRVVADAWCEAHGHGAAISFGLASDITNAIPGGGASHAASLPYVVRCGE